MSGARTRGRPAPLLKPVLETEREECVCLPVPLGVCHSLPRGWRGAIGLQREGCVQLFFYAETLAAHRGALWRHHARSGPETTDGDGDP